MSEILEKMSTKPSFDGQEIKDKSGRKIVLRKPDIMDRFYLLRAMGSDTSNQSLIGMMLPTLYVAAIDGAPFPTPRTLLECEAGLKRLNEEGWDAVTQEVESHLKVDEEEAKNTIKK